MALLSAALLQTRSLLPTDLSPLYTVLHMPLSVQLPPLQTLSLSVVITITTTACIITMVQGTIVMRSLLPPLLLTITTLRAMELLKIQVAQKGWSMWLVFIVISCIKKAYKRWDVFLTVTSLKATMVLHLRFPRAFTISHYILPMTLQSKNYNTSVMQGLYGVSLSERALSSRTPCTV